MTTRNGDMSTIIESEKILLSKGELEFCGYDLLQAACYPMLNNKSDRKVKVRMIVSKNGDVTDIIEQSWAEGELPDPSIAIHFLEMQTIGYGYGGNIDDLIEDYQCDGLEQKDIISTKVSITIEVTQSDTTSTKEKDDE